MLMSMEGLSETYMARGVSGILHVGAHEGQEHAAYREAFGPDIPIVWIEGDPDVYERLVKLMANDLNSVCLNAVVADRVSTVEFHIANNEQSSSILPLGTHKEAHPEVVYIGGVTVETTTIDILASQYDLFESLNFLNMDVQGAEGKVIAGAYEFLKGVDFVYSEVNQRELYVGCTTLDDFNDQMKVHGFRMTELDMIESFGWGDAFYVKGK